MGQARTETPRLPNCRPASAPTSATRACYTAYELAEMLAISIDRFYEVRAKLHDEQGMPRSVSIGRLRFPKVAIEAWLNRDHPNAPRQRPDNDPVPMPHPQNDDEHRAYLRRAYARR